MIDGRVCPWWFAYTVDNLLRRWLHNPGRIMDPHVKAGHTAVDASCGKGPFTVELARLVGPGGRAVAVDLQERMLQRVKRVGLATVPLRPPQSSSSWGTPGTNSAASPYR